MKKILNYLLEHQKAHGSWWLLMAFTLFLGLSFYINYAQKPILSYSGWLYWLRTYGFYGLAYFVGVVGYALVFKKQNFWSKPEFWVLSGALLLVPTLNDCANYYRDWGVFEINYFVRKVSFNLHCSVVYLAIPCLLMFIYEYNPHSKTFFGFTATGFDWRTYAIMLAIMLPLLWFVADRPDFLNTYPRYKPSHAEFYWDVPKWLTIGAYELSYALQFLSLELFFRGFFIFALSKYLGQGAVYPMVLIYAFIHFSKPMPEALGSIFGGFILGVVALRTGSVMGGVFIHIGVAWAMEYFAFRQLP